jgi:polar amino acid transport system substrate-binding protein
MMSKNKSALTAAAGLAAAAMMLTGCGGNSAASPAAGPADKASTANPSIQAMLPQKIKDAGVIRNAMPANLPPYAYKDKGKDLTGVIPDLTAAVGSVLGVKFEVVDTAFPGIVPALKADRADVVWSVMTDSPDREKELDFVNYFLAPAGFMVPKGNPKGIHSIEDTCGLQVGTLRGNSKLPELEAQGKKCVAAGKPTVTVKLYDETGAGQTQLRSGNIDAWFGGVTEQEYLAQSVDNGSVFEVTDARVGHTAYGVGVIKGNDDLVKAIQAATVEVIKSGEYDKILAKWHAEAGALKADGVIVNGAGKGIYK